MPPSFQLPDVATPPPPSRHLGLPNMLQRRMIAHLKGFCEVINNANTICHIGTLLSGRKMGPKVENFRKMFFWTLKWP